MILFRSMVALPAVLIFALLAALPGLAQTPPPAKTKAVYAKAKPARLRLILPADALAGADRVLILKKKGLKVIKSFKPVKSSLHPLAPGRYMLMLKLRTCCSRKPAAAALGLVDLKPGRERKVVMGGLEVSMSPGLGGGLRKIHFFHQASSRPLLSMRAKSARTLVSAIPLPPGVYTLAFEYTGCPKPMLAAGDIKVKPGEVTRHRISTGIALKGFGPELTGWDLMTHSGRKPALMVRRREKGNPFPLGEAFPVGAGDYDLILYGGDAKTPAREIRGITLVPGRILYQKAGF